MIGRIARAAVWSVGLLYVAYVVVINVFLSTSLFDKVVNHAEPDQIQVFYTRGWSLFPGRIHATGLKILGRDDNVEWQLEVDEISFDLALAKLARRRFEVSRVDGTGVSFRLRRRLHGPPESETEYVHLPPIQDAGPFSVQPGYVFYYDVWLDRFYKMWTVRLENVVAEHVREVWIDHERFEGDARITGRFYLKPVRAADVGPVRIDLRRGKVLRGDTVLAEGLVGRATVTIDRFDPRLIIDLTHKISIDTALRLRVPDVAALPRGGEHPLRGAVDVAMLALRLRRGVLDDGSHAALAMPRATLATEGGWRGGLAAAGVITAGGALHVRAALADLDGKAGRLDGATLAAAATLRDVTRPLTAARATLELGAGELRVAPVRARIAALRVDAQADTLSLGHPLRAFAARATTRRAELAAGGLRTTLDLEGSLEVDDYRARAAVDLQTHDLVAAHRGLTLGARVAARARVHDWDLRGGPLALDEARVVASALRVATARRTAVLAAPRVELVATSPRWSPRAPLERLRVTADVNDATVADVAPLNAMLGTTGLAARDAARLSLDLEADVDRRVVRGRVDLRAQGLGVATGTLRAFGDVVARARGVTLDFDAGTFAVADLRAIARSVSGGTLGRRNDFTVARLELGGRTPAMALARPTLRGVDLDLEIDGAALPDLGALQPLVGRGVTLEGGRATLSANLRVASAAGESGGVFAVVVEGGAVRLGGTRLAGDLRVRGVLRRAGGGSGEIDLAGTRVELRDLAVTGAAAQTRGWRGDLLLRGALLRLDGRPRLDAQLAVEADDARPLLALALRDGIPGFLVPFVDMPHLSGRALLGAGGGELALRNVYVSGGNLAVRGDYVASRRGKRGDFMVKKGPLSLRLRIGDDGLDVGALALGR